MSYRTRLPRANEDDPIVKQIIRARVRMLVQQPFFGTLAVHLKIVDATGWCPTMATDGFHLFFNRDWVAEQEFEQLVFVVAHEVMHAAYDQVARGAGRDPGVWNMAIDYLVNYSLVKANVGKMPYGGLYDEQYTDEMSSEEIYHMLLQNAVKIEVPLDYHMSPEEIQGDSGENKDDEGGLQNGGQEDTPLKAGKARGVIMNEPGCNSPPKLTQEEIEEIRQEMRNNIMQAAEVARAGGKDAGHIPAGIRRMIDQLLEPQIDWREYITDFIISAVKDDFTFQRFGRNSWPTGMILPGMDRTEEIEVAVTIDTSGSMTHEMLQDFLSEVHGIMQQFERFTLWLWTFDTSIYDFKVFTPDNIDEIREYPMSGGGGTLFECVWDFMKDPSAFGVEHEPIEPQRLILFTDGYPGNTWGDPDYCDTVFVVHGNNAPESSFGSCVKYIPRESKAA